MVQDLEEFTLQWLNHVNRLWQDIMCTHDADDIAFNAAGQVAMPNRSKPIEFFVAKRMQDYFPDRDSLLHSALYTSQKRSTWTYIPEGQMFSESGILKKVNKVAPTESLHASFEQAFKNYTVCVQITVVRGTHGSRTAWVHACAVETH